MLPRVVTIFATACVDLIGLCNGSAVAETLINIDLEHWLDTRISVPGEDIYE
jgi:hypothetical protein